MKTDLTTFRAQVKADKKRVRMTETAKANLRSLKSQQDVMTFRYERQRQKLAAIEPTTENLAKLIQQSEQPPVDTGFTLSPYPEFKIIKIVKPVDHLERRVQKLARWIDAGYRLGEEIDSLGTVRFLSDLSADERKMSDNKFSAIKIRPRAFTEKPKTRRSLEYKQAQMAKRQVSNDLASSAP